MSEREVEISILMAVYNTAKYLPEAIDSVIGQTFTDWELICVDDGSTDESLSILEGYARRDPRIRVIPQPHRGSASIARNCALQHATGRYIVMLDSDDYMSCDVLNAMHERAIQTGADAVLPDLCFYRHDSAMQSQMLIGISNDRSAIISGRHAVRLSLDWSIHGLALSQGNIIRSIQYDENGMNGDEYSTRMLFHRCRTVAFSRGVYYYRLHPQSTTHTPGLKQYDRLDVDLRLHGMLVQNRYDAETIDLSTLLCYRHLAGLVRQIRTLQSGDREKAFGRLRQAYRVLDRRRLRQILRRRGGLKGRLNTLLVYLNFGGFWRVQSGIGLVQDQIRRIGWG